MPLGQLYKLAKKEGTFTMYGDGIRHHAFSGFRAEAGYWVNDNWAGEVSFFQFETKNKRFHIESDGEPSIGRHYLDVSSSNNANTNTYLIFAEPANPNMAGSTRTSGYIEKRYVDIGDQVKAGALLANIIAPELDHQITQAKATLAQNQATLQQTQASRELAQVTNARDSNLVKQGWLTLQQGDNDRLTLQAQQAAVGVAQSNIAAQEAQIRILEQEKAYQRVVAPFDGVITQRNIDNGSLVTSGSTFMFTLMHPNVIRTQVFVPQDQAFGLAPGVDAVVRVPEIPGRSFPGKVTRIASALQPGSRTLLTEIDVPNPDGALDPGIYCTVELFIPRKTPSMIVPADAVVFDQNGLHVAVVENGTAHLQKITIARDFGTEVEVHDGVRPGDQVILNPMVNLAEGSKVAVRKPQTS